MSKIKQAVWKKVEDGTLEDEGKRSDKEEQQSGQIQGGRSSGEGCKWNTDSVLQSREYLHEG